MEPQPALLDREVETGLRTAAMLLQGRPVDQLDVDAAAKADGDRQLRRACAGK